ncbi:MAG: ATP-binding protein, partial [Chlorobiales bacterium]|nr:ATP-binding protein [Chlorobiales bacterium]
MANTMNIGTNLQGRLRNTTLSYSHGLMPLFEAVVNSIHAIEEAGLQPSDGNIIVEVLRRDQMALQLESGSKKKGPRPTNDIIGFKITDNGVGFDEDNIKSFETLDSEHKALKGGRGVGRLLWLKAFNRAVIQSKYKESDGSISDVKFIFNKNGIEDYEVTKNQISEIGTTVLLDGFIEAYREKSSKKLNIIASNILDHCLWYFVRPGGCPNINVFDREDSVDLVRLYDEYMINSAVVESVALKGNVFDLTHLKVYANQSNSHFVAYCADDRLVEKEFVAGKISGLHGKLTDANGDFFYACYVTSNYLNEHVRPERTDFNIVSDSNNLFSENELSFDDIRYGVYDKISSYLGGYLEENKELSMKRIERFVSDISPRYKPIIHRISSDKLNV